MAFCSSCGAQINNSSKFCAGCGAAVPQAAVSAPAAGVAAPVAAAPARGGSGVKVLLIILAVVFGLFVVGGAVATFVAWRFAKSVKVESGAGGATTVKTPFGTITADDPVATARELGIDVYPGATPLKGSATVNFAGMKVASARFETSDSPDEVAEFYKNKYPGANVRVMDEDRRSLTFAGPNGMLAVQLYKSSDGTVIEMSRVGKPSSEEDAEDEKQ